MSTIATSFTALGAGIALSVRSGDKFTYSVSGTFVGTVVLERSVTAGAAWDSVVSATGSASGTVFVFTADRQAAQYRFRCSAFTSGTIVTSIADAAVAVNSFQDANGNDILVLNEDGVSIPGTLSVTGASTLAGAVSLSSTLSVTGAADFSSTATATGFIPSGSTATGNRFYLRTTNRPALSANSVKVMELGESGGVPFVLLSIPTTAQASIQADRTDGSLGVSGGSGLSDGGNFVAYGSTHASKANDIEFRNATTIKMNIDDSANVIISRLAFACIRTDVASAATITALSSGTSLVKLTGSTATSIQGVTSGSDGQILKIINLTGQNMTIAHENAGATAANRITTMTGADVVTTANGAAELIYDTGSSRWIATFVTA